MALMYHHVDVFSQVPFNGNCLPVVLDAGGLSAEQMLRISQEWRQFEAIALEPTADPTTVRAHVFDLFEELPFAGHPIIGAAAVLHHTSAHKEAQTWCIELPRKNVSLTTECASVSASPTLIVSVLLKAGSIHIIEKKL